MNISLIAAMASNGVIGRNNSLPWHLPGDLKYFKRTTMGCSIIMGRKTWESIGRPLPGRTNIVVTRDQSYRAEGVRVVHSLDEAIRLAKSIAEIDGSDEAFVIGGAELYSQAVPLADRLHLTRVHADVDGDTRLEAFREADWKEISREDFAAEGPNPYAYSICVLEKKREA